MKNKTLFATLALAAATPAIVMPMVQQTNEVQAATYDRVFKDVSKSNAYYDIIHTMAAKGIINGYPDGNFKGDTTLSRQHAAALIVRAVKTLPKTKIFEKPADLSSSNPYYNDIKALMEADLLQVDSTGNITPNKSLTRGEMAKILATAYKLSSSNTHPLTDVSSQYDAYVSALYQANVTTGFEDKTFKENTSLTRAHYAVFMYRAEQFKQNGITLDDLAKMTPEETVKLTDEQFLYVVEALKHKRYSIPTSLNDVNIGKLLEENKKLFNQEAVRIKAAGFVYANFYNDPMVYQNVSSMLNAWAVNTDMSVAEIVNVLNAVYLEGKVVTLGDRPNATRNVVMYYDYSKGLLVFGGSIKQKE